MHRHVTARRKKEQGAQQQLGVWVNRLQVGLLKVWVDDADSRVSDKWDIFSVWLKPNVSRCGQGERKGGQETLCVSLHRAP